MFFEKKDAKRARCRPFGMCDVCEPRVSARRVRREAFNIARSEGEGREEKTGQPDIVVERFANEGVAGSTPSESYLCGTGKIQVKNVRYEAKSAKFSSERGEPPTPRYRAGVRAAEKSEFSVRFAYHLRSRLP